MCPCETTHTHEGDICIDFSRISVPLPDHAFKQILDDKMGLNSDQQSDMSPCELLTVQ